MQKTGNRHSPLLDELTKIAQTEKKEETTPDWFKEALTQPKKPTLKELLAQFGAEVDPTMGEVPGAPMADVPPEETGADTEEAKRGMCEALSALCGSLEEAHSCLDQYCGEPEGEGMGMGIEDELAPATPVEAPSPMEAPPSPVEAPPSPMPMPGLI